MATPFLLDREFLTTLERVTLLCRTDLSGPVGADHRSRSHGPGLEYSDYRRYSSGDDPRYLDWNAYLRLGKLFLKIYETERHFPVRILLDRSESMGYDDATKAKFLYAQRLTATFAYLALLHLDTAAVIPFADRIGKPIIVSGGRDSFWPVLEFLAAQSCSGTTRLYESTKDFLRTFSTPGIAFVVSDFFDEEGCEQALEALRAAGHDFVLVQVHSAEEQRPSITGDLILEDAETGAQRALESSSESVSLYERDFLQFSDRLQKLAARHGGRYARAVTSIPYQEFVLRGLRTSRVVA
jgi:uncharacterized protein (DUF58 family)